jgi:hypothetical protein
MSFYADSWLRQARESVSSGPDQSPSARQLGKVADAVEKAIKAVLIENRGSIPPQRNHQTLADLCQTTGLWDVLPPAFKRLVEDAEFYRLKNTAEPDEAVAAVLSAQQMAGYFLVTRRLIDYMEHHVIGNDSVLKRLKVV